jgi:uncharacterized membrane protein YsdA (DUF1294 family)
MKDWIWIVLLAAVGFLLGGAYSAWKTAKTGLLILLLLLTLLAATATYFWYQST